MNKGHIYKGQYEGWYSVSDEEFLSEEEVCDQKLESGETQKVSLWLKELRMWVYDQWNSEGEFVI